jgi:hypothetical protein
LNLIERFVVAEIEASDSVETLFRTNSNATKLCKFFSVLSGSDYLDLCVKPVILRIVEEKKDCEIDPSKVKDMSKLQENLNHLMEYCRAMIDSIVASLVQRPQWLQFICSVLWCNVEAKFGQFKYAAVGGFFFLRFLCPAILTPDAHGMIPVVSKELRRTLTLMAKVLQNISNGVEFGAKEEFMICLNPFICTQIPIVKSLFGSLVASDVPVLAGACEEAKPVQLSVIDRSIEAVYKQILFQQRKLSSSHSAVFQVLEPIISIIGVPEKLKRSLAAQKANV